MDPDTVAGPLVDERRWKGANLTAILGASAVAAGVLLLAAGWYGVSGEAAVAKQIPYLASATAPGTALLIAGVVLLAPLLRGADGRADATDRLLELLTEPEPTTPAPSPGPADDGRLLALPAGTHYHRVGCSLVLGKPDAHPVDAATIEQRGYGRVRRVALTQPVGRDPRTEPVTTVDLALAGLGVGAIAALAGLGLLVTYRVTGVFNLAFGAVAALAAELLRHAVRVWDLPAAPAALAIVAVVCPALGVAMSVLVFRPLERRRAGTAESLVASLGVFVVLVGVISLVWGTQSWPDAPALFSATPISLPFDLTVRRDSVAALVIVAVVGAGLTVLLRTRVGLTARAVVEDRDLAELTAIDTDRVSVLAWAGGSALAGLAGILIAPTLRLDPYGLTLVVLGTMAVAVIARLSSPLIAVAAALVIGIAQSELTQWHPDGRIGVLAQALSTNLYAVALLVALLAMRSLTDNDTESITSRLARRHDLRPPTGWWVPAILVLGAPLMFSGSDLRDALTVPALAVIFLSIVVVTGYTGQISLGQAGFAGLGALVAARLTHGGLGPLPEVPALTAGFLAALLVGLLGSLIARPAIRRRGLFLALTTFAVGSIISRFVFAQPAFVSGVHIGLPAPFTSDRGFYVLELLTLGAALLVVRNHHRGRLGRALLAVRDDEAGAEAAGVDSHRLRIWAFAVSTGLAALGGAMLASAQRSFDAATFDPIESLIWFAAVMVFGIDSATGAVLGAALLVTLDTVFGSGVSTLVIGVSAVLLGRLPGGLGYLARRLTAAAIDLLRGSDRRGPVGPPVRLSPAGRALASRVRR